MLHKLHSLSNLFIIKSDKDDPNILIEMSHKIRFVNHSGVASNKNT